MPSLDLARDVCLKSACKQHNDVATAALDCVAAACTGGTRRGVHSSPCAAGGAVVASCGRGVSRAGRLVLLTPSAAAVAGEGLVGSPNAMARTDREGGLHGGRARRKRRPQLLHLCDVLFETLHVGAPFQRTAS